MCHPEQILTKSNVFWELLFFVCKIQNKKHICNRYVFGSSRLRHDLRECGEGVIFFLRTLLKKRFDCLLQCEDPDMVEPYQHDQHTNHRSCHTTSSPFSLRSRCTALQPGFSDGGSRTSVSCSTITIAGKRKDSLKYYSIARLSCCGFSYVNSTDFQYNEILLLSQS